MLNLQDVTGESLWRRHQGSLFISHSGDLSLPISRVGYPGNAGPDSIVFIQTKEFAIESAETGAALAITNENFTEYLKNKVSGLLVVQNVKVALQVLLTEFSGAQKKLSPPTNHPNDVSPTAVIGPGVQIGSFASVGPGARLGANVILRGHVVIEENAVIGDDTTVEAGVVVGHHCRIGNGCLIHANTVIGADGFGFIPAAMPKKIPQIGIVVIEDHVEIGALCTIDRAALGETRIGSGTKMDNHCHIAHNCVVGRGCLIATGFWMAGSSSIGDHSFASGGVHILDHVHITGHVMLGARSGVSKDITEPGSYTGYPLQKVQDSLRTTQTLRTLPEMRRRLHSLEKIVAELQKSIEQKHV